MLATFWMKNQISYSFMILLAWHIGLDSQCPYWDQWLPFTFYTNSFTCKSKEPAVRQHERLYRMQRKQLDSEPCWKNWAVSERRLVLTQAAPVCGKSGVARLEEEGTILLLP